MISDVDETLRALVKREALNGTQVEIAFDAPTKDWVARRNAPTINLFLYDIREDLSRRDSSWGPVVSAEGFVTGHTPAPRRYKLAYLLTAWTQRAEDEHLLLSACLSAFLRHDSLAPSEMEGALADQPLPAILTVAQPLGPDRSIADIWTALGGEMKPSLDVVLTVPFVVHREVAAGAPVREVPRITVGRPDGEGAEDLAQRRGFGGRAPRRGPLLPKEPFAQDETVVGGTKEKPGRVYRLRGHERP